MGLAMGFHKNQKTAHQQNVKFKKSMLAMCIMAFSVPSFAQDTNEEKDASVEEIIVTGVRADLQNAQEIKRNADTFVDAISAEDIGSLPDRSVLEAMQRVPGVSIERFAAANDPDHFGVEGSGAVIRGMSQTRSEFNGRDSFTANSGRGLNFQDVPPELMAGVDIYKNQTADMIEGGISGTVSLRTRKPFDQDGRRFAVSADVTYGDMVEEATPTISALFSDRWDTDVGEFGFLVNLSDSKLEASSHGIQTDRYEFRRLEPRLSPGGNVQLPGFEYAENPYVYDGSFYFSGPNSGTANIPPVGTKGVLVPNGANMTMKNDERDRTGIALATQWESADDTLLASLQFMRSDATLAWTENAVKYQTGFNTDRTWGAPGEEYEFDENGVFLNGSLADVADGWRGDDDRIPHNVSPSAGWGTSPVYAFGHRFQADNRYKKTETIVDDYAFNLKWAPSDKFELIFDFQHIEAETNDDDVTLMLMTHAIMDYDLRGLPSLNISNPWAFATPENLAAHAADGRDYANGEVPYFQSPSSYNYNAAMDHYERSEGQSDAIRIDGTYAFDDGFFTKVKAGVRAAEREQTVRNSAYNWGRLAPIWDNPVGWLDSDVVKDTPMAQVTTLDWSDFYRGDVVNIEGGNKMLHPSDALVKDYANWGTYFAPLYNPNDNDTCADEWRPSAERVQSEWDPVAGRCLASTDLNGFFRDSEINSTTEENQAAYVRLDFETDIGERRASGNIGVRYVRITNETAGFTTYPELRRSEKLPADWDPRNVTGADFDLFDPENEFLGSPSNYVDDIYIGFANDAYTPNLAKRTYDDILPSFNLKVELTPEVIGRFAVSKAIALPDIGDLRNYTNIGSNDGFTYNFKDPYWGPNNPHPDTPIDPATGERHVSGLPATIDPTTGLPEFNEAGNPVYRGPDGEIVNQQRIVDADSITFGGWTGSSGNPLLMPMESIQYDASFEWYFSKVGSLTASFFYKDLENFFINGAYNREFTNPVSGVTQTVFVSGPQNGGKGEMKGFELGYTQFYDMLPAPWDGFGIQANYSYIEARGVPNSNLDGGTDFAFGGDIPLQGQSDHTANFVLMYDKNDWSVRLAYNWRSEYLLTSRDVITGLPVYNDDAGFMDGSIFYNVTDNVQVGFQGVNLLNTETRTFMQVDDNLRLGRSWFVNDRRYTFLVRATF